MKSKFDYCYCDGFLEICLLENNNNDIGLKRCCYLAPFKILSTSIILGPVAVTS